MSQTAKSVGARLPSAISSAEEEEEQEEEEEEEEEGLFKANAENPFYAAISFFCDGVASRTANWCWGPPARALPCGEFLVRA